MSDPLDDPDDDFGGTPSRTMTLDELRGSIRPMTVLERVEQHAMGKLKPPMDVTELRAAELFLKKTQPDLKALEHSGTVTTNYDSALLAFLATKEILPK